MRDFSTKTPIWCFMQWPWWTWSISWTSAKSYFLKQQAMSRKTTSSRIKRTFFCWSLCCIMEIPCFTPINLSSPAVSERMFLWRCCNPWFLRFLSRFQGNTKLQNGRQWNYKLRQQVSFYLLHQAHGSPACGWHHQIQHPEVLLLLAYVTQVQLDNPQHVKEHD